MTSDEMIGFGICFAGLIVALIGFCIVQHFEDKARAEWIRKVRDWKPVRRKADGG